MAPQRLFYYDRGLKLLPTKLAIDPPFREAQAFVSHAHSDHIAPHEFVLCTAETAALLRHRLGDRPTRVMPYGEPIAWGNVCLTAYPAGHCLGSAMLLVEYDGQRLLYTGDFKLRPALTVPPARLALADVLIMESTYGHPRYRFPPEDEVIQSLCELIDGAKGRGRIPVVVAYALGKAQEIARRLSDAEWPIVQHKTVAAISQIYESFGVKIGKYRIFDGHVLPDEVLIVSPGTKLPLAEERTFRIAVTGWAMDPAAKYRLNVDAAVPFSDHADYDGLFELIEAVGPKVIYTTHGPESFVRDLQSRGFCAYLLDGPTQKILF